MKQETLITVQGSFWEAALDCVVRAFPIYLRYPSRPPVSSSENTDSSVGLLLLILTLESHVNRLMYFEPKGLSTEDTLINKLYTYLPHEGYEPIRARVLELSACRDAITHALIWEELREYDDEHNIQRLSWRLAPTTKLRRKLEGVLEEGGIQTRQLKLNVVPSNIDLLDLVKGLVITCRTMRYLEAEYGNPRAWVGPILVSEEFERLFCTNAHNPEDSIEAILRRLHPFHLEGIVEVLGLTPVHCNNVLSFVGISERG